MEHPTDRPETVSPPELNPLLNPLLAQHMGRWAEVYFNSPPDKREEAVQNLLRELQGNHPQPENHEVASTAWSRTSLQPVHPEQIHMQHEVTAEAVTPQNERICPSCGHVNPSDHGYCGMCGTGLSDNSILPSRDAAEPVQGLPEPDEGQPRTYDSSEDVGRENHYFLAERRRVIEDDEDDHMMFESVGPSFSYGYRVFIGLVLAAMIGGLVYMTLRGGKSGTDVAPATAAAPPVADQPTSPAVNKSEAPKTEAAPANKVAAPETAAAGPNTNSARGPKETTPAPNGEPAPPVGATKSPRVQASRAPKAASVAPTTTNGAEELAIAQKYLNGSGGVSRDPAQAAQWLWKSIAKQNGQATLLLADMYLHGDGMQKNCEQARVLLDVAASKGMTAAGERLRHMQAFGCQ